MDIAITSENRQTYLLIESKGSLLTREELVTHSEMIYEEVAKYDCKKILVQETETHFPFELPHYFDLVKQYADNFPPELRQLKVAIVVSPEYKYIADTWESLCVSRGFQYFSFTSFDDAYTWLVS